MATTEPQRNVYVGHRYVPKLMGEWDQTQTYEGLSIVTYQGTSYTSKKRIPVGVLIANEEYWVVTGNYNAQVEGYRQEVKTLGTEFTDFKEGTTELLNQKITNILNVKSMGATGDGVTDDTAALQSALDKAAADNSDVVIPDGVYMVNAVVGIVLKSNMTVTLSRKAVIKAMPISGTHYNVILARDITNFKLVGGTIAGERNEHTGTTGEWGHGLNILGSSNGVIEGTHFIDCWGDGIAIADSAGRVSTDILIDSVTADNNRRQGLSVIASQSCKVINSTFKNTAGTKPAAGIDVESNPNGTYNNDLIIEGNQCYGNEGSGILVTQHPNAPINDGNISIVNNQCYENGLASVTESGIKLVRDKGTLVTGNSLHNNKRGLVLEYTTHSLVNDNQIVGNNYGIYIYGSSHNVCKGNLIRFHASYGVYISDQSNHNTIEGNTLIENGDFATQAIIMLRSNASHNNVSNNTLRNKLETTGRVVSAAAKSISLETKDLKPSDHYLNMKIFIIGGTGAGQSFKISAYDNPTNTVSVLGTFTTIPDTSSVYEIRSGTKYGIQILGVTEVENRVTGNDLYHTGVNDGQAYLSNIGTGTVLTSENRG